MIGENLARIRKERGLTQKELGEACGVSQSRIAEYEAEKKPLLRASGATLLALSQALSVSIEELLTGEKNHSKTEEIKAEIIRLVKEI